MSKEAGDTREYRVLRCSKDASAASGFEAVIRGLAVGTPTLVAADRPDAPPWATFGPWQRSDGELFVCVVIRGLTPRVDSSGRPIIEMRLFAVPFAIAAVHRLSYAALLSASLAAREPVANTTLVLDVEQTTVDDRVAGVEEVGFGFASSVAARLLDGSVALVGTPGGSLETKVRRLDAIVDLLPYGARAQLSASTWVHSATIHTIRLGFSNGARDEQARVTWNSPLAGDSLTPEARGYSDDLDGLVRRTSLSVVVQQLLTAFEPVEVNASTVNRVALASARDAVHAAESLGAGQGDVRQVRAVLDSDALVVLSDEEVEKMLRFLLEAGDASDRTRLLRAWPSGLVQPLVERAVAMLGSLDGATTLAACIELAARHSELADFFEALLERAGARPADGVNDPARTAVRSFVEVAWNAPRLLEHVRPTFLNSPTLSVALLEEQGPDAVRWLDPYRRDAGVIGVFGVACNLQPNRVVTRDAVTDLARIRTSGVASLLALAKAHHTLHRIVPAVAGWILTWMPDERRSARPGRNQMKTSLSVVAQAVQDESLEVIAVADVLHMLAWSELADAQRRWWLEAEPTDAEHYLNALCRYLASAELVPLRSDFALGLKSFLLTRSWTQPEYRHKQRVFDLLAFLIDGQEEHMVLEYVSQILAQFGRRLGNELDRAGDSGAVLRDRLGRLEGSVVAEMLAPPPAPVAPPPASRESYSVTSSRPGEVPIPESWGWRPVGPPSQTPDPVLPRVTVRDDDISSPARPRGHLQLKPSGWAAMMRRINGRTDTYASYRELTVEHKKSVLRQFAQAAVPSNAAAIEAMCSQMAEVRLFVEPRDVNGFLEDLFTMSELDLDSNAATRCAEVLRRAVDWGRFGDKLRAQVDQLWRPEELRPKHWSRKRPAT